jgi:hypothetical protein
MPHRDPCYTDSAFGRGKGFPQLRAVGAATASTCPKYDAKGFTCITWGQPKTMTLAFWKKYCDEAHTLFSQDWLTDKGSPAGFNQSQLQIDLHAIR